MIFPSNINSSFLKKFRKLVLSEVKKGRRFVIICGGGSINKEYNKAVKAIIKPTDEELDLVGIKATEMNAFFVKILFGGYAHKEVLTNPTKKIKTNKNIVIGCGWKPGCSTDKDAVLAAKTFNAKTVINLTNVGYIYTKDPRKHKDAKKIERINWKEFRKIIGNKWSPKLNAPFDPVAARLAEKLRLKVIVAKGDDIGNLKRILEGKRFRGSIIG